MAGGGLFGVYKSDLLADLSAMNGDLTEAEAELVSMGVPPFYYRELCWNGTKITRMSVNGLNDAFSLLSTDEKVRLRPQLLPLFDKAVKFYY